MCHCLRIEQICGDTTHCKASVLTVPPVTKQPQPWARSLFGKRWVILVLFFWRRKRFPYFFFFLRFLRRMYISCLNDRVICVSTAVHLNHFHWLSKQRLGYTTFQKLAVKVGKMGQAAKKCATAPLKFRFHTATGGPARLQKPICINSSCPWN